MPPPSLSDAPSQPEATAKPSILPLLLDPNLWDLPPGLTQELKDHNAIDILQQLPLLSSIREKPAGGIPILGNVVNSILSHIIWYVEQNQAGRLLLPHTSAQDTLCLFN